MKWRLERRLERRQKQRQLLLKRPFSPGDRVVLAHDAYVQNVTIPKGTHAIYHKRLPWTFIAPACDVEIVGMTGPYGYPYVALSEEDIKHEEQGDKLV